MTRLEDLLRETMVATNAYVDPSPDLFDRIRSDIDTDRQRRTSHRRGAIIATVVTAISASALALLAYRQGEFDMDWWILELIAFAILTAIALVLGPFIKRFGRSYAADVFRSNPSTGKSFIVLTDFAYYLIFSAYILFTTTVDRPSDWPSTVGAEQVQQNIIRGGGIFLIIGLLHGVNLLVLPIIGRLLTLNRRLDQQMRGLSERDLGDRDLTQSEESDPS